MVLLKDIKRRVNLGDVFVGFCDITTYANTLKIKLDKIVEYESNTIFLLTCSYPGTALHEKIKWKFYEENMYYLYIYIDIYIFKNYWSLKFFIISYRTRTTVNRLNSCGEINDWLPSKTAGISSF